MLVLNLISAIGLCNLSGLAQAYSGSAAYHTHTQGLGKCSLSLSNYRYFTSVGPSTYQDAKICGQCARVTNPQNNRQVVVTIADQCLDCAAENLVMNQAAFEQIADINLGRVNVNWEIIRCPEVSGNIQYFWETGSNQWWAAFQVRNHAVGVSKVELYYNQQWNQMTRRSDNYFIIPNTGLTQHRIKITSVNGNVVEDGNIPILEQGGLVSSSGQF